MIPYNSSNDIYSFSYKINNEYTKNSLIYQNSVFYNINTKISNYNKNDIKKNFIFLNKLYLSSANWTSNKNGFYAWEDTYYLESLIKMYKVTLDLYYLNLFVEVANKIINTTDIHLGIKDYYRNKITPGWSSIKYTYTWSNSAISTIFTVHNSLICWRLLEFYNLIKNNNELYDYYNIAKQYLDTCTSIMATLDEDYIETPGRGGYFKNPFHKIRFPDGEEPLNYTFINGLSCLEYYKATKNIKYKNYFIKTCEYFKHFINMPGQTAKIYDDCLTWDYFPIINKKVHSDNTFTIKTPKPEDIAHGSFAVDFIYNAYIENIIFTKNDLIKLSNTFIKYIKNNDNINWYIDGTSQIYKNFLYRASIISKYLVLAQFDKNIYKIIHNYYYSLHHTNIISQSLRSNIQNKSYHIGAYVILPYANILYYKDH